MLIITIALCTSLMAVVFAATAATAATTNTKVTPEQGVNNSYSYSRIYAKVIQNISSTPIGFVYADVLQMRRSFSSGIGVYARQSIPADTVLLVLPPSLQLTLSRLRKMYPMYSDAVDEVIANDIDDLVPRPGSAESTDLLQKSSFYALCGAHLALKRQSNEFDLYTSLVDAYDCSTPLDWPAENLALLPGAARTSALLRRRLLNRMWDSMRRRRKGGGAAEGSNNIIVGYKFWSWGVCNCLSRFFITRSKEPALIPFAFCFNHHGDPSLDYVFGSAGEFELSTRREVAAGDELKISYGAHLDDGWVLEYGFISPNLNYYASMKLPMTTSMLLHVNKSAEFEAPLVPPRFVPHRSPLLFSAIKQWSFALIDRNDDDDSNDFKQPFLSLRGVMDQSASSTSGAAGSWPAHFYAELCVAVALLDESLRATEMHSFGLTLLASARVYSPQLSLRAAQWQQRLCAEALHELNGNGGEDADAERIRTIHLQLKQMEEEEEEVAGNENLESIDFQEEVAVKLKRRRLRQTLTALQLRRIKRKTLKTCIVSALNTQNSLIRGRLPSAPSIADAAVHRLPNAPRRPTPYFEHSDEETSPLRFEAPIVAWPIRNRMSQEINVYWYDVTKKQEQFMSLVDPGGEITLNVYVGNRFIARTADHEGKNSFIAEHNVADLRPFTVTTKHTTLEKKKKKKKKKEKKEEEKKKLVDEFHARVAAVNDDHNTLPIGTRINNISIINALSGGLAVNIYWQHPDTMEEELFVDALLPGNEQRISTFSGHTFVFRRADDGSNQFLLRKMIQRNESIVINDESVAVAWSRLEQASPVPPVPVPVPAAVEKLEPNTPLKQVPFINMHHSPAALYWSPYEVNEGDDHDIEEKLFYTLEAGAEVKFDSYAGHRITARDAITNGFLCSFIITRNQKYAISAQVEEMEAEFEENAVTIDEYGIVVPISLPKKHKKN